MDVFLVGCLLACPQAVCTQVVPIVSCVDDVGVVQLTNCLKLLDCRVAAAAAVGSAACCRLCRLWRPCLAPHTPPTLFCRVAKSVQQMLQLWWEDCIDKGWVWQVLRQWEACSNSRSSSSNSIGALAMITRSSTAIHPASATHPQPPPAHPRPAVTSGAGLSTDTKIQPQ